MTKNDDTGFIKTVERELARPITAAHQAGALAGKLVQLREVYAVSPDQFETLVANYSARVHSAGLDDVLARQLIYATTLAASSGDLIYEELHKLLSLCDEVFSLQSLGFSAPEGVWLDFEKAVRSRISEQRDEARMAARDRAKEWMKDRWWYSTLLGPG